MLHRHPLHRHVVQHSALHQLVSSESGRTSGLSPAGMPGVSTDAESVLAPVPAEPPSEPTKDTTFDKWPKSAEMRIHVIDGRTLQPLEGAEVVCIESEQRLRTDKDGYTPWVDAPLIRDPRYRPMVAELHGQLGVVVYKNGYRDSIHLGIRMHENVRSQTTVWMYKIGPGDRRIEPVLYQVPYHHLWLIRLADRFRSRTQIGEGFQQP